MIKQFNNLSEEEARILLKAPALISVNAACSLNAVDPTQKADAIRLSHLKTFTAHPMLIPYYTEVEKHFKDDFEAAVQLYHPFNREKMDKLRRDIDQIKKVVQKLEPEYARLLLKSFEKYERHVRRAAHNFVQDFIFPIPIPGLSD
jgi:hypothetical protein